MILQQIGNMVAANSCIIYTVTKEMGTVIKRNRLFWIQDMDGTSYDIQSRIRILYEQVERQWI